MKTKKTNKNDSLYDCTYYVSFCTKYKRKILNKEKQDFLEKYLKQISDEYDFEIMEINIIENNILLKINCSPELGISTAINKLKNLSAKALLEKFPELESRIPCIWTRNTYIKTVGIFNKEDIIKFIEMQNKY